MGTKSNQRGKYMYNKILVPLDGSKLAESVLEHVVAVAVGCHSPEVVLVSVTEPIKVNVPANTVHEGHEKPRGTDLHFERISSAHYVIAGSLHNEGKQFSRTTIGKLYTQADKYLGRIQRRLEKMGVKANTEVLLGNPAEAIVSYADQNGVDLIIMASHGRTGLSRWAYGSVADKVFRASCVPVLMVRVPGCKPEVQI